MIVLLLICSCKQEKAYSKTYFDYFNTVCTIVGYEQKESKFKETLELLEPHLDKYHKLYDIYNEYSGINNIYTINKNAGKNYIKVDQSVIELLKYGKDIYTLTGGMVNIAMGSVLKLWHNEREYANEFPQLAKTPSIESLNIASQYTNINDLIINEEENSVFLKCEEMSLDVGAIAKGYVAEELANILLANNKKGYMINLGGNIKLVGEKPNEEKWTVGVQNPNFDSDNTYIAVLSVSDYSVVTSGSYQRYYMVEDKLYHHIIDPISLMPKDDYSSITIVTKNSALADSLSTALFNITIEEGKKLISKFEDTYAMWVDSDYQVYYSEGFEKLR